MDIQAIYEEAMRRAGIMTSPTPLTSPGFPVSYDDYLQMISTPGGSSFVKRLVPYSQLARFEAEIHNLKCEQQNKRTADAAKAAALSNSEAEQDAFCSEYSSLKKDEIALFKEFKEAQEAKKHEEEAAVARKAAEVIAAREEERATAIQLFREMAEEFFNQIYKDEREILRVGKTMLESGPGSIGWPNGLIKMWRNKRYTGKIEWRNYTHSYSDGVWTPAKDGFDWDGWPLKDEADVEVNKLLNEDWKMYLNFCLHLVKHHEQNGPFPPEATLRIKALEAESATQQLRIEVLESKLDILREAFRKV